MTRARPVKSLPAPPRTHVREARYAEGQPVPVIDVAGVDLSRARMGLSAKRHRDTTDLRAMLADTVLEYTTLLRRDQIARGVHPDDCVEIVEEYDPVVAMALIGVRGNDELALQAHAQVAKYVRPTLKSVEVISDKGSVEEAAQRSAKAASLFELLGDMGRNRRLEHDAKVAAEGVQLDTPDEVLK